MKERIQKILSEQGYCSRRAAEQIIREGRVKVNGHPAGLGDKVDILTDTLSVDGVRIMFEKRRQMLYYMLNKPRGYVTTMDDPHATKTIRDLIGEIGGRVYPVGRLDKDSEGLLLLTNDGELAHLISHPSSKISKTYRVTVSPRPDEQQIVRLSEGVRLDDGYTTAPMVLRLLTEQKDRGVLEFVITEGRNRQVRRMCQAVGLDVLRLKRTAIGPLKLNGIASGQYRALKKSELIALRNAIK